MRTAVLVMACLALGLLLTQGELAAATAVPTFQSIGLTVPYQGDSDRERSCSVRYRKKGEEPWREGHPLFNDTEGREFRGSLVLLAPGTAYEVEATVADAQGRDPAVSRIEAQTWPEDFPVAETAWIEPGVQKKPLAIGRSGSATGYLLFSARPGREKETVIDVEGNEDNNVTISANYVIVRGLVLRNARTHAIEIQRGHHIVVERCEITGWGRPGGSEKSDLDAGVYARQRRDPIARIVVQDNAIGPPRGCANPWGQGHPLGPQAISFVETDGNHVIRYNTLASDAAHRYNDAVGGGWNSGPKGAPHRDSDIYGNLIAHANDDGIEAEGQNINIRIWGNKTENTFVGIALAPTIKGPCYVFRNVITAYEGVAFKLGEGDRKGHGALYLYHNAVHSPRPRTEAYAGWGGKGLFKHLTARNNIINVNGYVLDDGRREPTNSYDYDLMNALDRERFMKWGQDRLSLRQMREQLGFWQHGVTGDPCFADPAKGDFTLRKESPAVDRAVRLPGFNDGFRGPAPDIGPFELGDAPPTYGPRPRAAMSHSQ